MIQKKMKYKPIITKEKAYKGLRKLPKKNSIVSNFNILCNYNNDLYIVEYEPLINCLLLKFKNNKFYFVRKLPFKLERIIKLKNNNFIMYSDYELILIKPH